MCQHPNFAATIIQFARQPLLRSNGVRLPSRTLDARDGDCSAEVTPAAGRVLRVVVGTALVGLGLVQMNVLHVDLRRFEPALHGALRHQAALRRRRPLAGFGLFGFLYLGAGFG